VRCTNCTALPGFPCTKVAVAVYRFQGGNVLAVCQYALDFMLDIADDHPDLEPESLEWLVPVEAVA
jgi:hypothetical protein